MRGCAYGKPARWASIKEPHDFKRKSWQTCAMDSHPLIIAGAGIAGLAAAVALGDRDILMLEKASQFSTIGAGLQLGPNAVRALQKLGAWDAVEPITSTAPEIHMWDGISGKRLKRLPLGHDFENRFGSPYRLAHRGELHEALLSIVRGRNNISVRLGSDVLSAEISGSSTKLMTIQGEQFAQSVIATDGVNSAIRRSLFHASEPVDSGETYHRALLPIPKVQGIDMECVNLWMYPDAHVVHYPVGKVQRLNLVAIIPSLHAPNTYLSKAAPALRQIISLMSGQSSTWDALFGKPLKSWTKGNTLLLGDAAHAALPYLAQGAAMALEDAACLKKSLQDHRQLVGAFTATERQRLARTTRLQAQSMQAGKIYHASGAARAIRNAVLKATPARVFAAQLAWIYEHKS
jgi:salicylate hydroxylase